MLRRLSVLGISTLLIFTASCASKKKAGEEAGAGGGDAGATIDQQAMTFNAQGSDSGQISGLSTVNFAYDSSTLDGRAREVLKSNSAWMKTNSGLTVQVEGHCDTRGSVEYNLALGERRAKAVKDYLVGLGVDAKRLTVISYGKEKLLELGDSEVVHSRNRRANFVPLAN